MHAPIYPWWVDVIGWLSAAISIYTFYARTMVPLRIAAIVGCIFALLFAYFRENTQTMVANAILLPLNVVRLIQMRRLIADARMAVNAPADYDWLRPFTHKVDFRAGDPLFHKGEIGNAAYLVGSGEVLVPEHNAVVTNGALLGEIGLLTSGHRRTASAIAKTDVRAWRISYDDLEQLCMQDPAFCLHMARVIVHRYEANLGRDARLH